jgi:C1A family cysteine protease
MSLVPAFSYSAFDEDEHEHGGSQYMSFDAFAQTYGKQYATDETRAQAQVCFEQNLGQIAEWNSGSSTANYGVNQFSDQCANDFDRRRKGLNASSSATTSASDSSEHVVCEATTSSSTATAALASTVDATSYAAVDWVAKGATTAVKNQADCGSCWAFSTTEQVESDYCISKGTLGKCVELAPQQLVSCDMTNLGCNGGMPYVAMTYIASAGGQVSETSYPYVSGSSTTCEEGATCAFDKADVVVQLDSTTPYTTVSGEPSSSQDESAILAALQKGPVSIVIDASKWQSYKSGIMSAAECGTSIDHAVQAVGYVKADGDTPAHYIVRNSWGTDWGVTTSGDETGTDRGYILMEAGDNACNVTYSVVTANIASDK